MTIKHNNHNRPHQYRPTYFTDNKSMKINEFHSSLSEYKKVQLIGPMRVHKEAIDETLPIIFVDGGVKFQKDFQAPTISIGDNDSNESGNKLDIELDNIKDYSDLDAALALVPSHIEEIYLHGFLGGRLDHQMINMGSIHHFLKKKNSAMTCHLGPQLLATSKKQISFGHNGNFSLMSLEKQVVKISGACEYKILNEVEIDTLSSHTLSNIANGEVNLECELPIFIYLD